MRSVKHRQRSSAACGTVKEQSLAQTTRCRTTELRPTAPASAFALWNLGFRPFYLFASIFAAVSIPLWVCQYARGW